MVRSRVCPKNRLTARLVHLLAKVHGACVRMSSTLSGSASMCRCDTYAPSSCTAAQPKSTFSTVIQIQAVHKQIARCFQQRILSSSVALIVTRSSTYRHKYFWGAGSPSISARLLTGASSSSPGLVPEGMVMRITVRYNQWAYGHYPREW
eukprot:COSAG05_NODE_123_length_17568_cov_235.438148_5_plen_150_part_00